jgi:hypothetical protein
MTMTITDDEALVRATLQGLAEAHDGEALSAALDDFGFAELLIESPQVGVSSLFRAMGRAGSSCGALNDVLTAAFHASTGVDVSQDTVPLPRPGEDHAALLHDGVIDIRGLCIAPRPDRAVLLAAAGQDGFGWFRVAPGALVTMRQVTGLDPTLTVAESDAAGVHGDLVLEGQDAGQAWDNVLAAGRRALGWQIVGGAEQMLTLATEHATQRVQFGHAIGSFQAVRHRLADVSVAQHAAIAALDQCGEADDEIFASMVAKSLAGRAARIAGTHCQQVLAGIGFTAEHPFHSYLRRTMVLDRLLGSSADLPAKIGAVLAAQGTVPRLVEL